MDNTTNRELRLTKDLKAPLELVWKVWTEPAHIQAWWGPDGFTSTIQKMEFYEGGEWRLSMTGPNGTVYPNRSIFKEIIPFRKIELEHFNPHFIATVFFESLAGETRIEWVSVFDTSADFDIIVKTFKADEGQIQNIEKFEKYLSIVSEP
jgi:uncharacterized protein YndB with AHSA1/START domain